MSVLLIAETNWLENIVLAQDSTSAYLFRRLLRILGRNTIQSYFTQKTKRILTILKFMWSWGTQVLRLCSIRVRVLRG